MAAVSRVDGSGVEVILDKLDDEDRPHCPHGPTILFERYCNGKYRRFYACSSCRDRKQCDFYQNEGDSVSEAANKARQTVIKDYLSYAKKFKYARLANAIKKPSERKFCRKCHLLFTNDEAANHQDHPCFEKIDEEELNKPTQLLTPLDNNKSNAQYLFSEKTLAFINDTIKTLGFTHILCIGTPSLPEHIDERKYMLLDIDCRLGQFYSPDTFAHYNMFNHYFFGGEKARLRYKHFLTDASQGKLAVFIDPPFGGLVDLLDHTLCRIASDLKEVKTDGSLDEKELMTIFWIFPYFLENRVIDKNSSLNMLDYKVDYRNHEAFQEGPKGRKLGSPVRIFTNMKLKSILLPKDEYRYCGLCEKYVALGNIHCKACKTCPSKDGSTYVHCDFCEKCVKPSRTHCFKCGSCVLPGHSCGSKPGAGCFICGDLTHKRNACPQKDAAKEGKVIKRCSEDEGGVPEKKRKGSKNKSAPKRFWKGKGKNKRK